MYIKRIKKIDRKEKESKNHQGSSAANQLGGSTR
jgi:hypothetical protein